jgi:sugar-specific transcriptional regulator TrmB
MESLRALRKKGAVAEVKTVSPGKKGVYHAGDAAELAREEKMNLQEVFRFMDSERFGVLTTATKSGHRRLR